MSKLVAAALLLAGVIAAMPAIADTEQAACRGVPVRLFEAHIPEQIGRYAFEGRMLDQFLQLWRTARRPKLPHSPERVTVYAVPGRPYLVGYHRQGCVIAFLAVEREQFWRWLRPQIGWPA